MKKVSVSDAATFFGVSKEAIHNRIRRGSLDVTLVDGIKMVVINTDEATKQVRKTVTRATAQGDKYYQLLEEQNKKLQERVAFLEAETRLLRDQKEAMLIEERKKIEQIYKDRDEQLKTVLSTLSTQFMLTQHKEEEPEHLEAEIEETPAILEVKSKIISLKKFMKKLNISKSKQEKIEKKFKRLQKKDERIILEDGKFFVDVKKFNYDDLIL
jgi:DNA repair exonuclease SbcCD ATPase subunit